MLRLRIPPKLNAVFDALFRSEWNCCLTDGKMEDNWKVNFNNSGVTFQNSSIHFKLVKKGGAGNTAAPQTYCIRLDQSAGC